MGVLRAHTGAIGCIGLSSSLGTRYNEVQQKEASPGHCSLYIIALSLNIICAT